MSILIDAKLCLGCGECCGICPGSLLRLVKNETGASYAQLRYPEECWNCASCVKKCPAQAISLYLPPESGGRGGRMQVSAEGSLLYWKITLPDGRRKTIIVDSQNANKY
ncbi:MAG: ferredoxin family protein [Deltaproteobacteria bacterium]|jgi:adenylylsulfate reductase subunit B|nr:ferredoxin family protein [Deltaproteobacteria bacterium]